jgi:hypothetical protein
MRISQVRPEMLETGQTAVVAEDGASNQWQTYLQNMLGARFHHRPRNDGGRRLLLAGMPGEYHDIALLLFALAANEKGYHLLPLGANMPLAELGLRRLRERLH